MINRIDLSGEWRVALDRERKGAGPVYTDTIVLPDTTSHAGLGEINNKREEGFLTDTRLFEGDAWYSRSIDLTGVKGSTAKLFLERTRLTELYIDGELIGSRDSLTAPHVYDISAFIGGVHTAAVRVTNTDYPIKGGHMTSPDTQTNWNGITGEISVRIYGSVYADEVRVTPLFGERAFRVYARIKGAESGKATVSAVSFNGTKPPHEPKPVAAMFTGGELLCTLPLGRDARTWDEYTPELYKISVRIGEDVTVVTAGLREFAAAGHKFTINGRKTFLRGRHNGLLFPKTGYAPTDVESWLGDMRIAKSYGINHYRFHTCCPPEAAFEAADRLGIFMEPELPFWGTIQAPGEEGFNEQEQDYLIAEGFRMLAEFGSHPSFVMMSMGNELWGSAERLDSIIAAFKRFDGRHLYTQGSNNFQFVPKTVPNDDFFAGVRLSRDRLLRGSYAMCDAPLGHVQTDKPSAMHSYDPAMLPGDTEDTGTADEMQIQYGTGTKTVKAESAEKPFIPDIPVITHEIGQYETFPNFDEIKKYTGSIKARNLEIFRGRMEEKGLLPLAHDYFEASGALAVQCWKEECEAALRSERLAGFQLLDIQDFTGQGTALVGVLDAFMDEKGICSPEQWRQFCNDAVILALFPDYCLEGGSRFEAEIRLTNYRPGIEGKRFSAKLFCQCGNVKAELSGTVPPGNYVSLGRLETVLPSPKEPKRFRLELEIEDTDIRNSYELFVFPKESEALPAELVFTELDSTAEKLLAEGRTILLARDPDTLENSVEGFYCTDFWCYPMFRSISASMNKPEPVGTMGLLIDSTHPALAKFPARKYSEPQWWTAVTNSRSELIDTLPNRSDIRVIVRTIDNFETNRDLALMYEYDRGSGKVLVLNSRLDALKNTPEGRALLASVAAYLKE